MRRPPVAKREIAPLSALLFVLFAATSLASGISGKVTDSQTGNPLASMVVAAYTPAGLLQATATTDLAGRYSLNVPAGSFRVLAYDNAGVYATTFYGDASSFETTALISGDSSNVNFALKRGGTISGSVSNAAGSASGLTVAAYNLDGSRRGFTTTSASGTYTLVLPPGNYKVAAYDDAGFLWPKFFPDQNSFASAPTINVAASQNSIADFHLEAAAHIIGTVTDADTLAPLGSIIVSAYDVSGTLVSSTLSAFDGSFNLKTPAGTFRVVVSDPRQTFATAYYGGVTFATATNIALAAGVTQASVQVPLRRAGFVSGQVTDTTGAPLQVTVAAYGLDGTLRATTETANGIFNLALPPGDYKLAAYDTRFVFATQFYSQQKAFSAANIVTVTSGTVPSAVKLFVLSHGARITGTIVDAQTSAPISGITVAAYDTNSEILSSGTSNAAGQYLFVVPAGAYRLVAFDNSLRYATEFSGGNAYETSRVYTETADGVESFNFSMKRGIQVTGRVKDASGAAISGVAVSALDPSGNHAGSAVATNGAFTIVLLPNKYRFVITDPGLRYNAYSSPAVNVTWDTPVQTLSVTLSAAQRRRSVRH